MEKRKVLGLLCCLLSSAGVVWGQTTLATHLVINEVEYDGKGVSGTDAANEWIELFNPTSSPVVIDGWQVDDGDGEGVWTIPDPTGGNDYIIPPLSFCVIANDADAFKAEYGKDPDFAKSVGATSATLLGGTGTVSLNNSNDQIYLRDASDTIIDAVGWNTPQETTDPIANPVSVSVADGEAIIRKQAGYEGAESTGELSELLGNAWDKTSNGDYEREGPDTKSDTPVPVELSTFTARVVDDGILLEWTTESETENLGFHVYRSEVLNGDFTRLTAELIPGAGTAALRHRYSYLDRSAGDNGYYYKIADVDFRGNYRFHGPVQVAGGSGGPVKFELEQNYPNPFYGATRFSYRLAMSGEVQLTIYNLLGQPIRMLVTGPQAAGLHSTSWDGTDRHGVRVSGGAYFFELKTGEQRLLRKMIFRR